LTLLAAPVITRERVTDLARLWVLAKAKMNDIEAFLKQYVDESGPLSVDGRTLGYYERSSSEVDAPAVVRALVEHGLDRSAIFDFLKVQKTAVDELAANHRGDNEETKAAKSVLRAKIKAATTKTTSLAFGLTKEKSHA
jgi:hypothetical protein